MSEIQQPTPADLTRQAADDLAVCEATSGGRWFVRDAGGGEAILCHREDDGTFKLALFRGWDKNRENAEFAALADEALPA